MYIHKAVGKRFSLLFSWVLRNSDARVLELTRAFQPQSTSEVAAEASSDDTARAPLADVALAAGSGKPKG